MAEFVNYAEASGIPARANSVLGGAGIKTSHKDPDNPRQYGQVVLEPAEGGDPVYLFADNDVAEKLGALLVENNGKVPGVVELRISRSGTRVLDFIAGEKLK